MKMNTRMAQRCVDVLMAGAVMATLVSCGPKDVEPTPFGEGGSSGGGSTGKGGYGGSSSGSGGGSTAQGGSSVGTGGGTSSAGGSGVTNGGGSGNPGLGGSTGAGGTAASGTTITDLETGMHYFENKPIGVVGAWFSYGDSTVGAALTPAGGTTFKPAQPGNASLYSACLKGAGFTTWGAGMGFNLNDPGDGKGGSAVQSFNATPYTSFTFWAKATTALSIKFKVPTKSSDPAGKVCMGDTGAMACYNHPAREVALTTDWQPYTVTFSSLAQEAGWGLQAPVNPADFFGVRLEVGKAAGNFEFCVDGFAFGK